MFVNLKSLSTGKHSVQLVLNFFQEVNFYEFIKKNLVTSMKQTSHLTKQLNNTNQLQLEATTFRRNFCSRAFNSFFPPTSTKREN